MPTDPAPEGRTLPPLPGPQTCTPTRDREKEAVTYRQTEAIRACARDLPPDKNVNNGDEAEQVDPATQKPTYAASFTKGMEHDKDLGEVVRRGDYELLLTAVNTELPADFDAVPRTPIPAPPPGTPDPRFRYVDPQAGIAFDTEGPDPASPAKFDQTVMPVPIALAPRFKDPAFSAEMGEVYAQALLREVPLNQLVAGSANADVLFAVARLNEFSTPVWPVISPTNPKTDPGRLFRGLFPGDLDGPYLSQFLLIGSRVDEGTGPADQFSAVIPPNTSTGLTLTRKQGQIQYGTITIDQRVQEVRSVPNTIDRDDNARFDFVTDVETWLDVQNGFRPTAPNLNAFTGQRAFTYTGRQLANWFHFDQNFQAYYNAAFLILGMQERAMATGQTLFNPGNPYPMGGNQEGFGTFGNAHVLSLLSEVGTRAIKGTWYVKWFNQRRARPEVAARRIHEVVLQPALNARYNIDGEILNAEKLLGAVLDRNRATNEALGRPTEDSYLLSQAFPEGSPLHPSLPSGHAAIAGASVTILKALFDGKFRITDSRDPILQPNDDGTALVEYVVPPGQPMPSLTLEGELNKLASNAALARDWAGVHYRSDATEGLLLGEYIAVGVLQEQARSFNPGHFYELTLFGGQKIRIARDGVITVV